MYDKATRESTSCDTALSELRHQVLPITLHECTYTHNCLQKYSRIYIRTTYSYAPLYSGELHIACIVS